MSPLLSMCTYIFSSSDWAGPAFEYIPSHVMATHTLVLFFLSELGKVVATKP